jgi:hypothetical protein
VGSFDLLGDDVLTWRLAAVVVAELIHNCISKSQILYAWMLLPCHNQDHESS